jgi:hypothetical protein
LTYPLEYHLEPEDDLERKLTADYEAAVQEQKRLAELEIKSAAPENIRSPDIFHQLKTARKPGKPREFFLVFFFSNPPINTLIRIY